MNNFDETYAQLIARCESSTVLMLTKTLRAGPSSMTALRIFDQIADYPADMISTFEDRKPIVGKLLNAALQQSEDNLR